MPVHISYHRGGFDPAAPAKNKAEEINGDTGQYTRWDEAGNVLEQRPLADDERAHVAPADAMAADQVNLAKDG